MTAATSADPAREGRAALAWAVVEGRVALAQNGGDEDRARRTTKRTGRGARGATAGSVDRGRCGPAWAAAGPARAPGASDDCGERPALGDRVLGAGPAERERELARLSDQSVMPMRGAAST